MPVYPVSQKTSGYHISNNVVYVVHRIHWEIFIYMQLSNVHQSMSKGDGVCACVCDINIKHDQIHTSLSSPLSLQSIPDQHK